MKRRVFIFVFAICAVFFLSVSAKAVELSLFENEKEMLENSVPEDVRSGLKDIGSESVDKLASGGLDSGAVLGYGAKLISNELQGPLSSLFMLLVTVLICSIAEGYTYSLRYTETRGIMAVAVSLFISAVVLAPVSEMLTASMNVIQSASSVMLLYLPIMAGVLMFSGRAISSAGYYAAVSSMAELVSWVGANILMPLLSLFLSVSVCAGMSVRVNLRSIIESLSKAFKWILTFLMAVFVAIIGLNGVLSDSADGIADKAARFTLSSLIPLVGSSISEAYGAVRGSLGVLRSGMGVFVILAIALSFLPVIIRCVLWNAALYAAKTVSETLGVGSAVSVLGSLSSFLSALRAVLICVMTAFILSSTVMMRIGGYG